jgi:hypothetical protein
MGDPWSEYPFQLLVGTRPEKAELCRSLEATDLALRKSLQPEALRQMKGDHYHPTSEKNR